MIKSYSEYKEYYKSDLISTGIYHKKWYNKIYDGRFKFYRSLRYTEYYYNCKNKIYQKIIKKILMIRHSNLCDKYNCTIAGVPARKISNNTSEKYIIPLLKNNNNKNSNEFQSKHNMRNGCDNIKVCHVTSSHDRYDGRIFQKECCSLSKKYSVILLCADAKENEIKNGVEIMSVFTKNKNRIKRLFVIPKKLKKKCMDIDADIYHFHDPELIFLANFIKKRGKIVIFDSHEDNLNRIDNRVWIPTIIKPLFKKMYGFIEKKVLKKVDAIITVTDHIYDRLIKINSNTFIITNYPIIENFQYHDKKYKNKLCFAGGVSDNYMHYNILSAISDLDVEYSIAGPVFDGYLKKLNKNPGFKKVNLLGKISKKECDALYLKSNIGMVLIDYLPNINYKKGSMGITKIYEYMAFGIPVVATDLEIWKGFIHNKCGICVNPNNVDEIKSAIEFLIDNPQKAHEFGMNGRKLVESKYNWKTQEDELFRIYSIIINKKKGKS